MSDIEFASSNNNLILRGLPDLRQLYGEYEEAVMKGHGRYYEFVNSPEMKKEHPDLVADVMLKYFADFNFITGRMMDIYGGLQWKMTVEPGQAKIISAAHQQLHDTYGRIFDAVAEVVPLTFYHKNNPNNDQPLHTFTIGLENSPVMYINVHKNRSHTITKYMWGQIGLRLMDIGVQFKADEIGVRERSSSFFSLRLWWD